MSSLISLLLMAAKMRSFIAFFGLWTLFIGFRWMESPARPESR